MQSMTSMMLWKSQPFLISSLLISMLWLRLILRSRSAFRIIWLSLSLSFSCFSSADVEVQVSSIRNLKLTPIQNSQRYGHSTQSSSRIGADTLATWMLVSQKSSISLLCFTMVAMSWLMSGTMTLPCSLATLKWVMLGILASRPLMALKSGEQLSDRKKRERYSKGLPLKGAQNPNYRSYSSNDCYSYDSAPLASPFSSAKQGSIYDSRPALMTKILACIFLCRPMIFFMQTSAPTNSLSMSGMAMESSLRLQKSSVFLVTKALRSESMSWRWSQNLQMNLQQSSRFLMSYSCLCGDSASMFWLRQLKLIQAKCIDRSFTYMQLQRISYQTASQKPLPSRLSSLSVTLTLIWNSLRLALGGGAAEAMSLALRDLNLKSRQSRLAMTNDQSQQVLSLPCSCGEMQMTSGQSFAASRWHSSILLLRQFASSFPRRADSCSPRQAAAIFSTYSEQDLLRLMVQSYL